MMALEAKEEKFAAGGINIRMRRRCITLVGVVKFLLVVVRIRIRSRTCD
jgi:hypothetical protein